MAQPEPDEADLAARRLDAALARIAETSAKPRIDPRITAKLNSLIRALRTALDQ